MLHMIPTGLLVIAFTGAGIVNALGMAGTRANLVRWGYPAWWCHLTGALEILAAALLALQATREFGLILGAGIILTAVATVLRHRDYTHLAPLGVFALLLAVVQIVP